MNILSKNGVWRWDGGLIVFETYVENGKIIVAWIRGGN